MHSGGFRHEAFLYAGTDEFVAAGVDFLDAAVAAGDPVLVMTDRVKIDRLRSELDGRTGAVRFADMAVVGHNPARIIPAWRSFADAHAPGTALWGIGEPIWAGRSPSELDECAHHEALLNLAFADAEQFHLMCPYDTSSLSDRVVQAAHHTHPLVSNEVGPQASEAYAGVDVDALLAEALPGPATSVQAVKLDVDDLPALRRHVGQIADDAGLDAERGHDLVLAVDEVVTNTHRHGGGAGVLQSWTEGGTVVCDVRDSGRIRDPLVGRREPPVSQIGGRGLWIANQLCDLVQIRSSDSGTTVRLHMRAHSPRAA